MRWRSAGFVACMQLVYIFCSKRHQTGPQPMCPNFILIICTQVEPPYLSACSMSPSLVLCSFFPICSLSILAEQMWCTVSTRLPLVSFGKEGSVPPEGSLQKLIIKVENGTSAGPKATTHSIAGKPLGISGRRALRGGHSLPILPGACVS